MVFIILDVEATCWEKETEKLGKSQEVIEIGAVKVDEDGDVIGRFEAFVRPVLFPMLSDFCKNLTSISQIQVNQAKTYPDVVQQFQDWIGVDDGEEYLLCSWGFFDAKILARNCRQHGLEEEWTEPHISLKHQYPRLKGIARTWGLRKTVEAEGFDFDGSHHRGIDDAINLSKIFVKYQTQWAY